MAFIKVNERTGIELSINPDAILVLVDKAHYANTKTEIILVNNSYHVTETVVEIEALITP